MSTKVLPVRFIRWAATYAVRPCTGFCASPADPLGHGCPCPANDRLCEEAVWFSQTLLLGTKKDIDDIADALLKIYENRDKLA